MSAAFLTAAGEAALHAAGVSVIRQARRLRDNFFPHLFTPRQKDVQVIADWALGLVGRRLPAAKRPRPHFCDRGEQLDLFGMAS